MNNETLLNENQAADFLTVKTRTLQAWRAKDSVGPKFYKIGRLIRYKKSGLESWLEGQVRQSTSDKGEG